MPNNTLMHIDLQLFNGAASGGASGGASAPSGGEATTAGDTASLPKVENRGRNRRNSGALSNVVYGKQDADATDTLSPAAEGTGVGNANKSGVSTTSDTKEAKRQAFKELIEGDYKDEYTEMFQQAFNRRFKDVKSMETTIANQKPIMDLLMQRYKVADADISKLQAAIENDNVYWEEAAEEAGLTVEQYKAMQKLKQENEQFRLMQRRAQGEQQAQAKLNEWYAEADKLKSIYPSFDFKREINNVEFQKLLKAGIPVQKAYELIHIDEITQATARQAAQNAGKQMAANIKNRQSRPTENGTSSQSAVIVKNDVSRLSKADRQEIARRAARGERISF